MSLSDPNVFTISGINGGAAVNLPRVLTQGYSSRYQSADETLILNVAHMDFVPKGGRPHVRTTYDLSRVIQPDTDDPLVKDYGSVKLVIDRPKVGLTATEVDNLVQALKAKLTTAVVTQLYGKES